MMELSSQLDSTLPTLVQPEVGLEDLSVHFGEVWSCVDGKIEIQTLINDPAESGTFPHSTSGHGGVFPADW